LSIIVQIGLCDNNRTFLTVHSILLLTVARCLQW